MKAVTVDIIRELDRKTIEEHGVPGEVLMERAGIGIARHIIEWLETIDSHASRAVILAGKGNNGGDAYVVARCLYESTDLDIVILAACPVEELEGEALIHATKTLEETPIKVTEQFEPEMFKLGDIVVDGLLGTGIKGSPRTPYANWIKMVNKLNLPVVSLDIPSGMNGDDGSGDNCIKADLTITIGLPKTGIVADRAIEQCGQLRFVDIGIPVSYVEAVDAGFEAEFDIDARQFLSRRPSSCHKNSIGRVLIIGGSTAYPGAPLLAAKSALRGGAGLVTLAIPEQIDYSYSDCHALIIKKITDNGNGIFCEESIDEISDLINEHDVIVVGPGISTQRCLIKFMAFVCTTDKTLVIDADALNIIAEVPNIYQEKNSNILTPHPGEMQRLMRAFDLDEMLGTSRLEQAAALAVAIDSTIVLKGARTVVASPDERYSINSSGSPALATAGSGDCLAGLLGACLLNQEDCFDAVKAAVFIHGLAGELSHCGMRGLIADDLPELIPAAMRKISPFA
ncbi:MAG: NAD(P)H-hydrate dehydratase [Victivallaceae bacterium]|nr:NAD(P)H-hydrate dehydratase [Victivallaceae bacterium]